MRPLTSTDDRWCERSTGQCDLCADSVTAASTQVTDRSCVCGRNLALFAEEIAAAEAEQQDKRRAAIAALVAQVERDPRVLAARRRAQEALNSITGLPREKTA